MIDTLVTGSAQWAHMERPSQHDLYTVREIQLLFRVSRRTIANWQRKQILKPVKYGGKKLLFRRSDIERLIKGGLEVQP